MNRHTLELKLIVASMLLTGGKRKLKHTKRKRGYSLMFPDTKSELVYFKQGPDVWLAKIDSYKPGDGSLLMNTLYRLFPKKNIFIDVFQNKKNAIKFYKKHLFNIVKKVKQGSEKFFIMKRPAQEPNVQDYEPIEVK